jgi:hypothetical protein
VAEKTALLAFDNMASDGIVTDLQADLHFLLFTTLGTREYLQRLGRGEGSGGETVKVLFHERNLGKGAAIRTEVLKQIQLRSNRFGFELEIVIKVAKLGCRISEVPIAYRGRSYSGGKKIGWREQIQPLR